MLHGVGTRPLGQRASRSVLSFLHQWPCCGGGGSPPFFPEYVCSAALRLTTSEPFCGSRLIKTGGVACAGVVFLCWVDLCSAPAFV